MFQSNRNQPLALNLQHKLNKAASALGAADAFTPVRDLFMRKFGPVIRAQAGSPAAELSMLGKIAALLPSHTRRSEESQALQQFSTPLALGFVAASAAAITPADLALEPSAGTGLRVGLARRPRQAAR